MKFLKGLALSLLSFLLFLSLSIFGLLFTLNNTILNPAFVVSELDRLDISSLTKEILSEQIPRDEPFMAEVLDNTITDLEPWIKEQARVSVYAVYDYLMGRSQGLSLTVPLEPVRDSVKENLRQAILQSPPPELKGAPPGAIDIYLNEAYRQIDEQIPQSLAFDTDSVSPEVMSYLQQTKQVIGYVQIGYKALIGFILLLILGIILIYREVRGATRGLGITFLTSGVITYLGNFATKYFAEAGIMQLSLPAQLQTWLPQLLADFLAPLDMYSIGLAVIGIVLLIISFVYKPRQSSF